MNLSQLLGGGTNNLHLDVKYWKEFNISDLFELERGKIVSLNDIEEGKIPIISSSGENQGISFYGNIKPLYKNKLTASLNGVNTGYISYHNYDFNINTDCCVLLEKFNINNQIGLFLTTVMNCFSCKYSYGRKLSLDRFRNEIIKLPIEYEIEEINGNIIYKTDMDGNKVPKIDTTHKYSSKGYIPDFKFMEDYINQLHYSDRI